MKKIFTLIAVAAMALAAQASTLVVCDGTDWSVNLPVYGYYYDAEGAYGQMIYPAEMLAGMKDSQITKVMFHCDGVNKFYGGKLMLSLKEVEQDRFTSYSDIDDAMPVAIIEPEYGTYTIEFELTEPFEYHGGNLLVEAYVAEAGTYGNTYFLGQDMEYNASYYTYYWWYTNEYLDNFLPKVTFTYEGGEVGPTERTDSPSASKVNYVEHDGDNYYNAYTVTLTPAETEPDCVIWYRIGVMEDGEYVFGPWTEYVAPFDIDDPGSYRIEAYAITEGKLESYPIADEFVVSKLTDVDELFAGKTVANVRYFNVAGQEMQQANGVTIMVTTFTDGTQSTVKVVK